MFGGDDVSDTTQELSLDEAEIISKYRKLDKRGKQAVFRIIEVEYSEFIDERDNREYRGIVSEIEQSKQVTI